jgi:hypothetical protein
MPGPPIDLLTLFGRFGREQHISLRDPQAAETFIASVREAVNAALSNDTLLHGQRTENMFEALAVSLGKYKLLTKEDAGRVHPEGKFTAPDFRVVLDDGTQWLIEVKNVFDANASRQRIRLRPEDVARLLGYSEATGTPLKLALYWAQWGIWTLIDPSDLKAEDGKLGIDMFSAVGLSELARLGDRMIGTIPPLKLRLFADRSKNCTLSLDGEVKFWIGDAAAYSGDTEITEPVERDIAWIFMQFGQWECSEPKALLAGDQLEAIEFTWTPRALSNPGQNFEMIGSLSSMFARYYAEQTLSKEGVVQTEAAMMPNWFAPLVNPAYKGKALPLWRFAIQSNRGAKAPVPQPQGDLPDASGVEANRAGTPESD